MSEVAAIVNSPGRAGVSREMRDAGAVGMSRAQGFLTSSPREEHLRVGPHLFLFCKAMPRISPPWAPAIYHYLYRTPMKNNAQGTTRSSDPRAPRYSIL
jgi:hypothetical protein